jgi:radical SAM protein with 4Fe4S-binding SPASM domain
VARSAGIRIGVIAVLTPASLVAGAAAFYRYFTDHLDIKDFQVNTPFAGGPAQMLWEEMPLPGEELCTFMADLFALWAERGYSDGVRLGPFDALVDHFCRRPAQLPCIWQENCAEQFVAIDARGNMAQCDCWVTSYPEYSFGNAFSDSGIARQLRSSSARADFLRRPEHLVRDDDCASCRYLPICHGGCPVRAYAARGTLFAKDPYCRMYKIIFERSEQFAREQLLRQAIEARRCPTSGLRVGGKEAMERGQFSL